VIVAAVEMGCNCCTVVVEGWHLDVVEESYFDFDFDSGKMLKLEVGLIFAVAVVESY